MEYSSADPSDHTGVSSTGFHLQRRSPVGIIRSFVRSFLAPIAKELVVNHLTTEELDAAMPVLVQKLKELNQHLSPTEQNSLEEILWSASSYVKDNMQGESLGAKYAKPKSSTATINMKQQIASLPESLK